jgi:hypothetical protein
MSDAPGGPDTPASEAPTTITRPLVAALWIAAVIIAAVWPVVSHFLRRSPA